MSSHSMQTVWTGPGSRRKLIDSVRSIGKHHLILHSPSVEAKYTMELKDSLESYPGNQCRLLPFSSRLLSLEQINSLVENHNLGRPDTIIAIGGGTVIDASKLLLHQFSNQLQRPSISHDPEPNSDPCTTPIPLFALPTTCGSGAEATSFATYYLGTKKQSLENPNLLPKFVSLDDELCQKLSTSVRISGGLDALTQAIESYWSIQSTEESRILASQSITKIMEFLPTAAKGDHQSLSEIQTAAYLSGKSINMTRTTLCHALAYPLTAQHGIAHGLAVAATLPAIFKFNLECEQRNYCGLQTIDEHRKKMTELARLLRSQSLHSTPSYLSAWIEKIGGISNLTDFTEIRAQDIENIVSEALQNTRSSNNPRRPDQFEVLNYILGDKKK